MSPLVSCVSTFDPQSCAVQYSNGTFRRWRPAGGSMATRNEFGVVMVISRYYFLFFPCVWEKSDLSAS